MIEARHYTLLDPGVWVWPHFSAKELACKGDGSIRMDTIFLDILELVRARYGRPMIVTSGYRSPAYNMKVSTTGPEGPHTTGQAVDIAVRGQDALDLLGVALSLGLSGIGVKQHGPSRFIHLDNLGATTTRPRPTIWTYP